MAHDKFQKQGWIRFPYDYRLAEWVRVARPVADSVADDPQIKAKWLRCGGTWFAGVNAFPNDHSGAVPDQNVPGLTGQVFDFIRDHLTLSGFSWDRAQISVCYPGYPLRWDGESEAAFRYRKNRDAAHVDGLKRSDPGRRRSPSETHAFILGIPLNTVPEGAAPLVVYEGSHEVMRHAFRVRLQDVPPETWSGEDVTEAYVAARREVFESCKRVTVTAQPGEAYLVHRLALHGVAPWTATNSDTDSRMIAYFRPDPRPGESPVWWLEEP